MSKKYMMLIMSMMSILICSLMAVAFVTLMERKVLSFMNIRLGPNKSGMSGIFQPFSDAMKLYTNESTNYKSSNMLTFLISPTLSLSLSLTMWVIFPFLKPVTEMKYGLMLLITILSMGVYPIMSAGWSSNSNYSMIGSMRALAQTISYEVSLVFILMSMFLPFGSMSFFYMMKEQKFMCNMFMMASVIMLLITILAELNRTPFDFAEGESELVSGFNTEYSSGTFAMIFMAEYMMILIFSMLTTILLFKLSYLDFMNFLSTLMFSFLLIWTRATLPRYRYDKLMDMSWKFILPISMMNIFLVVNMVIIWKN
uniref:NADH dehydrogenase subunit 1 n=1 Tax=Taeniothrips eucharii TaxID=1818613 RepID=UPI0030E29A2C